MKVGELNRGTLVLLAVVVLGAAGYLWWSQLYKPAVEERTTARGSADAAQQQLDQAKRQLAKAQAAFDDGTAKAKKANDAVARLQLARQTVPSKALIDDAVLVVGTVADQTGVSLAVEAEDKGSSDPAAATVSTLDGARAIDIPFRAAGTVSEMLDFMSRVEDTVQVHRSKLYPTGRLFNIMALKIEREEAEEGAGGAADEGDIEGPIVGPKDLLFEITIRIYTSSTENNATVGEATAGIDPVTGAPAASADPNAAAAPANANATGTGAATGATDATTAAPGGATSTTGAAPGSSGTNTSTPTTSGGTPAAGANSGTPAGGTP